jgi:hypothetical protein
MSLRLLIERQAESQIPMKELGYRSFGIAEICKEERE